jgi:hypothetical protein
LIAAHAKARANLTESPNKVLPAVYDLFLTAEIKHDEDGLRERLDLPPGKKRRTCSSTSLTGRQAHHVIEHIGGAPPFPMRLPTPSNRTISWNSSEKKAGSRRASKNFELFAAALPGVAKRRRHRTQRLHRI